MTIMVLWISYKVYKWSHPKSKGKLPPGSTGLPYIGETIQFFTPYHLYDIHPFIKKRVARYIYSCRLVDFPSFVPAIRFDK